MLGELFWVFLYLGVYLFDSPTPWAVQSRFLALLNAWIVSVASTALIIVGGSKYFDYNFHLMEPILAGYIKSLNVFFGSYLVVDLIFNLFAICRGRDKWTSASTSNVIHHVVGLICMYEFVETGKFQFNSLFYTFSEISSIFLHVAWLTSDKSGIDWCCDTRGLYFACGVTTYILFFIARILGSILLWTLYVIPNFHLFMQEPMILRILCVGGNGTLTILNVYWFWLLTKMLLRKLKQHKEE